MTLAANSNLSKELIQSIAAKYGRHMTKIGRVETGYRNTSFQFDTDTAERLNFILYKHEPDVLSLIKRTNELGGYLASKGLPVRSPIDDRILRVGRRYGSLYSYIDGETIPWEAYTKKHIKLLGMAMASFHDAARDYNGNLPDVEDIYSEIIIRMNHYFNDPSVERALATKLQATVQLPDFGAIISQARRLERRSVLHMDMVRSNILFQGATLKDHFSIGDVALSGIIDLEKAARGHVMFDVARTLAFLIVDCDKPAEDVRKYFLDSGYRKRGKQNLRPVSLPSGDLLDSLITLFLTYDFYKFLRQNPYESLPENHHFTRTIAVLREQKVVQ